MTNVIPFTQKLRQILWDRNIPIYKFSADTGITRENFFYRKNKRYKHSRYIYMAIAYYLNMTVEELIEGTDGMNDWYGDEI